jgi:hypothetical protein
MFELVSVVGSMALLNSNASGVVAPADAGRGHRRDGQRRRREGSDESDGTRGRGRDRRTLLRRALHTVLERQRAQQERLPGRHCEHERSVGGVGFGGERRAVGRDERRGSGDRALDEGQRRVGSRDHEVAGAPQPEGRP